MKKTGVVYLLFFFFLIRLAALEPEPVVSVYDEFDDGLYGKSVHRGVIVSVKKEAFARAETLDVKNVLEDSYLTAVVMDAGTGGKLLSGDFGLSSSMKDGARVFDYRKDGLDISFSIEKPKEKLIQMVSDFYSGDETWHDPLVEHYRENYVIRIFRAENVFDSWSDEISYNEAMVAATLLGDSDQWLWGIHDGADILNKGY